MAIDDPRPKTYRPIVRSPKGRERSWRYGEARAHLAELMDRVEDDRETVIITRHGRPSTVMISAEEWESMEATLHLLRSPRNAARLFEAMAQIERGEGVEVTMEELRLRMGLDR